MNDKWEHDEGKDGYGCGWCGAWAQVNEDYLCADCYED